jgi:hypothetical protein
MVMFPQVDSFTYIHTNDISLQNLLEMAEAVGQALPKASD